MSHPSEAEELLRARTLGFSTPRPGRRPSPRQVYGSEIDASDLEPVLLDLGISPQQVKRIEKCVSRRLVLMLEMVDGTAVLLKWPDADTELDNDYEYVVLRMLAEIGLPKHAASAIPRIIAGGPATRVIALDVMKDCLSLREMTSRSAVADVRYLVHLAAVLAELHTTPIAEAYARYPEWRLHPPVPKSVILTPYEYAHGCGLDFDAYLRVMLELEGEFQKIHDQWGPRGLVHYDLRDDNILLASDPDDPRTIRLIDWELAGFGDPLYDIGFLVSQFLMEPIRRFGDPRAESAARRNVRAFMGAYRRLTGIDEDAERRVVQYAGIAILIQATMRLQQLGVLNRIGHLCLQYGRRLIQDPPLEVVR